MTMATRIAAMGLAALVACAAVLPVRGQVIAAARVNGVDIPQERVERGFEEELRTRQMNLLQIRNPDRVKQMKREVLDNLIEQELFWQAARAAGIVVAPAEVDEAVETTKRAFRSADAFERRIQAEGFTPQGYRELVNKQVHARRYAQGVAAKAPAVTDSDVHRFYVDNPDRFQRPEQAHVRHIVLNVPPAASDAERAGKRAQLERILGEARAGGDFDALAREHSEAPTRQWGGAMEAFARGQAPPPVEAAAFSLAPGAVSDVIAIGDSLQIVKVEARTAAVVVSEESAREKIREHLQAVRASEAIAAEAQRLRASQDVKVLLPL